MKKRHGLAIIALLSAAALTLGGCSGTKQEASSDSAGGVHINLKGDYNPMERDQIKDGGELTLPILEISEQSNSLHANSVMDTLTLWRWYNALPVLFDGDGTWHPNPDYLTNVNAEEVDGKTVVTYDINPDAVFNDGTPSTGGPSKPPGRSATGRTKISACPAPTATN